jgi:hypothetical protein
MRLTTVFFANRAEVIDDMLTVEGGFWRSTTVAPNSVAFLSNLVVLCEVDRDDVGRQFTMEIDGQGPSGHQWTPAHTSSFTVAGPAQFMCMPRMILPIEPGGGLHTYTFRIDGQHERVDVPIAIRVAQT